MVIHQEWKVYRIDNYEHDLASVSADVVVLPEQSLHFHTHLDQVSMSEERKQKEYKLDSEVPLWIGDYLDLAEW